MVFQNYALYPHMTVFDNVGFALKPARVPKPEIDSRVHNAAAISALVPPCATATGGYVKTEMVRYDDGKIVCDDTALIIRRYYPWGSKRIPYTSIRQVKRRPLSPMRGSWRIWGSGDLVHWWNLDSARPKKDTALEIVGNRIVPTITPEDPDTVERILTEHLRPQ
jgi:hypothetical protein